MYTRINVAQMTFLQSSHAISTAVEATRSLQFLYLFGCPAGRAQVGQDEGMVVSFKIRR